MKKTIFALVPITLWILCLTACTQSSQPMAETPDLKFWTVGNSEDWKVRFEDFSFYAELKQDKTARDGFLYALAEQPLSKQDIIQQTGLTEAKVETLLDQCRAINWIKESEGKWATAIPVISDSQMVFIKERLQPLALKLAEQIKSTKEKLKVLYEKEKTPSDPAWDEIPHLVIDKLLIDGTFHAAIGDLEKEMTGKKFYTEMQKILPAFILEAGEQAAHFGCNWYRFEHSGAVKEVYFLHGTFMDRHTIPLNPYRGDPEFAALLAKISPTGDYSELSPAEVAILKKLDWIVNNRFLIPIIQADSIKPLIPLLRQMGQEMAVTVFTEYDVFIDAFNDSPYSDFLEGAGDYFQACYHIMFALVIDTLIDESILPPPPQPVPDSYAVYITLGSVWE